MKTYRYTARDLQGALHKGTLEADTTDEVYHKLKEKEQYCVSLEVQQDRTSPFSHKKMKLKDVAFFCRQLSIMLSAGLMVAKALDILYEREKSRGNKAAMLKLSEDIQKGLSLYEAMREQGAFFPMLLLNMVQAGERSGSLDEVMQKMSDHYEREYRLISKLRASMAYPIFLFLVTLTVMICLFVFVLPNFFTMFPDGEMPGITRAVMGISNVLTYQWPFLLLGVFVLVAIWLVLRERRTVKLVIDRIKLRMPLVGKQLRIIYISRLTHSLSVLYSSGIPMIDAVEMAVSVLDNTYITERFNEVLEDISQGEMLSTSIGKTALFDSMVTSMIFVGEESGSLDQMLTKLSTFYDNESEVALQKMASLLEPVMLVFIALMVGIIMAAVMLPVYSMYTSVL